MILSDGVIFVASWTWFGSAQAGRAGKGAQQEEQVGIVGGARGRGSAQGP